MHPLRTLAAVSLVARALAAQDYTVVFEGRPTRKVEVAVAGTLPTRVSAEDAFRYAVRVVERQGRFYWASRDMRELVRRESGAYVTFVALDGSGYVRVLSPMVLSLRDQLPPAQRATEPAYMEHLVVQLGAITYYGEPVRPAR